VAASGLTLCAAPGVKPTVAPSALMQPLWEDPQDLPNRDLYYGPWGKEHAPDPNVVYTFVRPKEHGFNPGVVVRDPSGRQWHVKQAADLGAETGDEGPVEVVLSRVLSAVGYHQPPVYYLSSFTMKDRSGVKRQPGGRFRLSLKELEDRGEWSWQKNPFVGSTPYEGLLGILLMFNSSDLKNSNNALYAVHAGDTTSQWYVVRDLGAALGETGRLAPIRNSPELLALEPLAAGVHDGFVEFNFHGLHGDLVRKRITPDEIGWASALLSRLTDAQWHDAFRAGGYAREKADAFIATLRARIAQGLKVGGYDPR
jgi:hypothetical protein